MKKREYYFQNIPACLLSERFKGRVNYCFILLYMVFTPVIFSGCESEIPGENLRVEGETTDDRVIRLYSANAQSLDAEYSYDNKILVFKAFQEEEKVTSILQAYADSSRRELVFEIKNVVDKNLPSYKLGSHLQVVDEAKRLTNSISIEEIKEFQSEFELFGKRIVSSDIFFESEMVKNIYFHNAILSTTERSLYSKSNCECTPMPTYFTDETGFWCQEDYLMNADVLVDGLNSYDSEYGLSPDEKDALEVLSLNVKGKDFVTGDHLLSVFESKESFNERVEYTYMLNNGLVEVNQLKTNGCLLGKGSSHGCCGNYSGCCYYAHPYCYVHDKLCTNCTPRWFCFSGCVPDEPHRDNLPSGYGPYGPTKEEIRLIKDIKPR